VALTRRRGTGARPRPARIALTLAAAIAFFLQSFITQTHIHGLPLLAAKGATVTAVADTGTNTPLDRYPAKEDPANCPLCQEVTHAGHYVTPAFALLVQPSERVTHVTPVVETRATDFILSHAWRSRAPPSA